MPKPSNPIIIAAMKTVLEIKGRASSGDIEPIYDNFRAALEKLMADGIDINQTNSAGRTPLDSVKSKIAQALANEDYVGYDEKFDYLNDLRSELAKILDIMVDHCAKSGRDLPKPKRPRGGR